MTPCPDPSRIAAAASGEDLGAERHAADCRDCRAALDDALAVRALAARLPPIALTAARRLALEASVLALAEREVPAVSSPPRARRRRAALVAVAGVAAVGVAILVGALVRGDVRTSSSSSPGDRVTAAAPPAASGLHPAAPPGPEVAPARVVADITARAGARFERRATPHSEQVVVQEGTIAIDASGNVRRTELVDHAGSASVRIEGARVEIRASRGAIRAVHVFAGSAEVVAGGRTVVVTAGTTWEAPTEAPAPVAGVGRAPVRPRPRPDPALAPDARVGAAAFAEGWSALRGGDHARAATLFARATTTPGIAEDATYWLAVAHHRAGDTTAAVSAFARFLDTYPSSPHAGAAHLALWRLLQSADPGRAAHHRQRAAADPDPRIRSAVTP